MNDSLVCWKCGASLAEVSLPLSRYAQCSGCGADLYTCRLCIHHEPRWHNACREERAEPPRDRDHANFCDWFSPRADAYCGADAAADAARAQLEALFGGKPAGLSAADAGRDGLEALFGKG